MSTARTIKDKKVNGQCMCGAVRFTAHGPLSPLIYCHCRQCRRSSGHFVAAAAVAKDQLEIPSGDTLAWFSSSAQARRGFCSRCGSSLFWEPRDGNHVSIMAGTLDTPTGIVAEKHIFVGDAGDYYQIEDGLPQHAQNHLRPDVADPA